MLDVLCSLFNRKMELVMMSHVVRRKQQKFSVKSM